MKIVVLARMPTQLSASRAEPTFEEVDEDLRHGQPALLAVEVADGERATWISADAS